MTVHARGASRGAGEGNCKNEKTVRERRGFGQVKVLALDFDGVIFDSAREVFAVAVDTYHDLQGRSTLDGTESIVEEPGDSDEGLYEEFMKIMPLGNRAEDFGVALAAIDAGRSPADQEAYGRFRDELDASWLERFHRRFYERRTDRMARDRESWLSLVRPYDRFVKILRRNRKRCTYAIATAKDRASVLALLGHHGLDELFDERTIVDKETGVTKDEHLRRLQHLTGADFGEMTFIDDKLNHLETVAPLGVRCVLAAWGYNGRREWDLARRRGFAVCNLDDVETVLGFG